MKKYFEAYLLFLICILFGQDFSGMQAQMPMQGTNAFTPFLMDIKDWNAENVQGMKMNMGNQSMINAVRTYKQGDKTITVMFMKGNSNAQSSDQTNNEFNAETNNSEIFNKRIKGFEVAGAWVKDEKVCTIHVSLIKSSNNASFINFSSENMNLNETIEFSKNFDWSKMKVTAENN